MIDSPAYWKLDIYEKITAVTIAYPGAEIILVLGIEQLEPITYTGTLKAIAASINLDQLAQATLQENKLEIKTYGIPYFVDSPSVCVIITDTTTEDFVLVFAPTVARHKLVNAYHQELFKAIEGQSIHPDTADWVLYPMYRQYYQAVFKALGLEIDGDRLSFKSRHEFLVATAPIFLEKRNLHVVGMSGLAQLMGYTIPDEEPVASDEPKEDTLLSAVTGALLTFKGRAGWVSDRFSLVELSALLTIASDRIQAANEEMDRRFGKGDKNAPIKPPPETKAEPESAQWKAMKSDVSDKLKNIGVTLPKGF